MRPPISATDDQKDEISGLEGIEDKLATVAKYYRRVVQKLKQIKKLPGLQNQRI